MTVKIILQEKKSRRPIPFVWVKLLGEKRNFVDDTNLRGVAEFEAIPEGKYTMKIRSADYRPYTATHYLSSNSIVEIKLDKAVVG